MKKFFILLIVFYSLAGFSQEDAWVYFTNKPNAQYFFNNPLEMLSQRSLDRRTAYSIPLDIRDVPLNQSYIDQIAAVSGISIKAKSKWFNAIHVRGSVSNINSLSVFSFVDYIKFADPSLNQKSKQEKFTEIRPVNKVLEANSNFSYGNSSNQIQMLKGHLLHQQNYTGSGKIIAVMDAGFPGVNTAQSFQRLRDNNKILGGYNFVDRNNNIYTGNSHGTLVLSTMGGFVENQLVGTAPDASYYLFITEDINSENPLEESNWVEAAEMADSLGVDIINTSLGYFDYDNPNYSYSYSNMNGVTSFISRGADIAFSKGMICVTSAGNSGNSSNPNITAPADAINTLTVGSVDSTGIYSSFSSIGPSFDNRIKPDVMAQGFNSVVSNVSGNITTASGTSFSGPIMAGLVACLWQATPSKNNSQIIQFIKQSADKFLNPNAQYGYGIPNFQIALNNALSNEEVKESAEVKIYPNPFSDFIDIIIPDNSFNFQIFIYNNLGQLVVERNMNSQNTGIDLGQLHTGIYQVKIMVDNKAIFKKIIKK